MNADLQLVAIVVKDYDPAIEFFAGRVGFFYRVDDFNATYERMVAAGVTFTSAPRTESYGKVAVFVDIAGNKWDLLGPA